MTLPGERTELHPELVAVLHRLQAAERTAVGADRRVAFRLTRAVLGAAHASGVTFDQLADALSVSASSVRTRVSRTEVVISAWGVEELTGFTPAELGVQPVDPIAPGATGDGYRVSDIVRVLLAMHGPKG
jgi:hypothetical protein